MGARVNVYCREGSTEDQAEARKSLSKLSVARTIFVGCRCDMGQQQLHLALKSTKR